MNLSFILNEDYLAYFILKRKMHDESKELEDIKNKIYSENNIGYKKILEEEFLDSSVYLKDDKIKKLVYEFISTDKFKEIYKSYNNKTKEALAVLILNNTININDKELINIQDNLWNKYNDSYRTLLSMNSFNISIFLLDEDIKKVINEFKSTEVFKKLYKETELYLMSIKKYWQDNIEMINNYLKNILKMNFDKEVVVYITHPGTCEGYSLNENKIVWGHYKGVNNPNYNLVYLTHEWLHCLLPFTDNDDEIAGSIKHSIIELISDYELYSILEGRSTLKEGHPYLEEYKKFLYPYWIKYIGLDENGIEERLQNDSISELNQVDNDNISKMNIEEFINFCSKKYLEVVNGKESKIVH